MKTSETKELIKVSLSEDDNYEKDEKDYFKIGSLEKIHKTNKIQEFLRIFKAVIFGTGIEKSIGDVGLLRKLANSPRLFKIIARYLMFKWPHNEEKQKITLDFKGNRHLRYVHKYTVKQDTIQVTTGSGRRAERYYQILSLPPRNLSQENILVIGGKNVVELFIAWLYGFKWNNIYAIDLFSLHPKIQIMDMEDIKYENDFFDNVTMANVYGYQLDPEKCITEISRVLKPGGFFVFNSSFVPDSELPVYKMKVNQLLEIFNRNNFEVIYHTHETKGENVSHIWSLQKINKLVTNPDPIL
jgi:SAM-dependent methyltransferase